MRSLRFVSLSMLFACVVEKEIPRADPAKTWEPADPNVGTRDVPDVRCATPPDVGAATGWRHSTSSYIAGAGDPHHRGIDLIASADDATQTLTGKITYGLTDKDLQDEDVELFACLGERWTPIGTARTDSDGRFYLALSGDERLPTGMRDLYVSVTGDRSGAHFLGFVAPAGTQLVVSDVDGTLTASENAYPMALVTGGDTPVHPNAPDALMMAAARDYSVVYITARGDRFTQDTRDWLAAKGFPRGPIRMPTSIVTMPGEDTIEYKTEALASLAAFEIAAGIGNRASDISAYTSAGVAADRIFIKLAEYEEEYTALLAAAEAIGFPHYDDLRTQYFAEL